MAWSSLILVVGILLFLTLNTRAIVPRACVHNVTKQPAYCCPVPKGAIGPCGYPHRGVCALVQVHRAPRSIKNYGTTFAKDIRVDWPVRLFQWMCRCAGKFWGLACETCRYGYEGDTCQHRVVYTRRNISTYSLKEKQRWLAVLDAARKTPSDLMKPYGLAPGRLRSYRPMSVYEAAVVIHFFASSYTPPHQACSYNRMVDMNHKNPIFILWHRYLILWWERQLRQIAVRNFGWHNFTEPYWDFTDAKNCTICTRDFICEPQRREGMPFPASCVIANWTNFCDYSSLYCNCEGPQFGNVTRSWSRFIDKSRSYLPTAQEIRYALQAPVFTNPSFTGFAEYIERGKYCLRSVFSQEQMHDLVHDMFIGSMKSKTASLNDPLFHLHHSQLDRLLHRWILAARPTIAQIPKKSKKPQICRHCAMVGFLPIVQPTDMLIDLQELGVTYDSLSFGPISENISVPLASSISAYHRQLCPKKSHKQKKEFMEDSVVDRFLRRILKARMIADQVDDLAEMDDDDDDD